MFLVNISKGLYIVLTEMPKEIRMKQTTKQ